MLYILTLKFKLPNSISIINILRDLKAEYPTQLKGVGVVSEAGDITARLEFSEFDDMLKALDKSQSSEKLPKPGFLIHSIQDETSIRD